MRTTDGIDIEAPIELVWRVYADVERWPTWTASVRRVTYVAGGPPLAMGSKVRISQPRLPTVTWAVTALRPGTTWEWTARSPGATTVAGHVLTARGPAATRVDQWIEQRGVLGAAVGRLAAGLTRRYLRMEAEGLKAAAEARVADPGRSA